jgi:cell pole-organizing protein PopZ
MGFMAQPAKAQEPTMEEILASIRRIIADDDAAKPQSKPASPKPPEPPAKAAPPVAAASSEPMGQDDIDAMLSAVEDDLDDVVPGQSESRSEVLELTEAMATPPPEPKPPAFRKIDAEQDLVFDEPPPAPSAPPQPAPPRPDLTHDGSEPPLLSPAATAVVNSAFGTLAHSMLVQNAKTLEDLVKEMLRPLLKAWLDDNLPTLVERLVRAEIERVSRGRPG